MLLIIACRNQVISFSHRLMSCAARLITEELSRVQLVLRKSRDGVPEDRELDVEALKAVLGIVKARRRNQRTRSSIRRSDTSS
jgi:hypothetical protein